MVAFQQAPLFPDVCRPFSYAVKQTPLNYVQIDTAGSSEQGSVTLQSQCYFMCCALTVWTNYDNVGPVIATADSVAALSTPFTPNNFTLKIQRDINNNYSNNPMPQAMIASSGYRAGKVFPIPVIYSPRSNLQFTFQDTTGLFLLDALSGGDPVPLQIRMFMVGYNIPVSQWNKFASSFPHFACVYGPPSL